PGTPWGESTSFLLARPPKKLAAASALVPGVRVLTMARGRLPMRLDKFTIKAQEALQAAHDLAEQRHHQEMAPEHLLLALLQQEQGVTGAILRKLGIDP